MRNRGLVIEERAPEDFVFGSSLSLGKKFGDKVLLPSGDWRTVIFDGLKSHQAPGYETQSCVTHGTLNAEELLYKLQYSQTYDFSDRQLAKVGGTDPNGGASPKQIAEAFRKKFTTYENEWPTSAAKTTAEFYAEVPAHLLTLAKERGEEWDAGYEYVNTDLTTLKEALKYSPVGISVPAWVVQDGVYIRPPGMTDNHWVCLLHIDEHNHLHILDSYDPFIKVCNFIPSVAMRYYLTSRVELVNRVSLLQKLVAALTSLRDLWQIFNRSNVDLPAKDLPMNAPDKPDYIQLMAEGIKEFEGWKPGSKSWRNNNPGNIKSVAGGFLVFKTPEAGMDYLKMYLRRACTGAHKAYKPSMSIKDFFSVYAPDGPTIINNYTNHVCKHMKVFPSKRLSELV